MPFNISPSSYQGGSYLFAGISGLGKGIADALEKSQEQSKMESYNDSIVQHAYQQGQVDLEQLTKYRQMSHTQKTGFAASLAANFAEDMKRQQLQAMEEQRQAQAELRRQQAAAFSFTPPPEAFAAAEATGNKLVQIGPGKYQPVPYGGSGQDEVVTDPLKINGKEVPGIGVNRKTGQYVYYGGMQGGGLQVEVDPRTGVPFYRDNKGNPKPLTGQQIMSGQMMPQASPTPTATPSMDDAIKQVIDNLSTGEPPPATATPAPAAAAKGNDVAKVKVKSPDGKIGYIPASQLEAALKQGYTRAQ